MEGFPLSLSEWHQQRELKILMLPDHLKGGAIGAAAIDDLGSYPFCGRNDRNAFQGVPRSGGFNLLDMVRKKNTEL